MLEYLFFTMGSDSSEPKSKKDDGESNPEVFEPILPVSWILCLLIALIVATLFLVLFSIWQASLGA